MERENLSSISEEWESARTSGRLVPYWIASTAPIKGLSLDHDISVDVAVIGAGISGMTTA